MGGSKRQETRSSSFRSTSGRRDLTTAGRKSQNQVKVVNVGCMSGIFHLVFKYHTSPQFLTFGKRGEKQVPTAPAKPNTTTYQSRDNDTGGRSSLDIPRSPGIPAQIRNNINSNTINWPAREKRRKLVGALEKCDEDLKALKRIIEAVRVSQTPPRKKIENARVDEEEEIRELVGATNNNSTPSPVSVLHFSGSPPSITFSKYGQELKQEDHIQKQETRKMKREKDEHLISDLRFLNKSSLTRTNSAINITTLTSSLFPLPLSKQWSPLSNAARRTRRSSLTMLPWSKAVVESVEEVCRDVEREFKLEFGQIGLLIQDFIFEELLEEFIKDMMLMLMKKKRSCDYVFSSSSVFGLPHEACKRKLCF